MISEVNDILIDGAKFGESESKASNFEKAYYEYVLKQVQEELTALEEDYGVRILNGFDEEAQLGYQYQLAEVYFEAGEEALAPEATKAVKEVFAAYDTRGYWTESSIEAYDAGEISLGSYSFKYDRFLTPEDEEDVLFYERIEMLNDEAEFVRKEQKVFKDTNISLQDVVDVLVDAEGGIAWYTNYREE